MTTLSQIITPFFTVTRFPTTAPVSMNAWSPMLQCSPTRAPAITCANAQMRVPVPTCSLSHSAFWWMKAARGSITATGSPYGLDQRLGCSLLASLRDPGVDGEGKDLVRRPLGNREVAAATTELTKGRLQVRGVG